MNTKQYLRDHPCYLVAALALAAEGDSEILVKIYGGEKAAFDALQIAKTYGNTMKVHQSTDFPIYVSPAGEITKIPERLAGLILSGIENFTVLYCDRFPTQSYGDSWIWTLPKGMQEKLLAKYGELIQEKRFETQPSHPSHRPITPVD